MKTRRPEEACTQSNFDRTKAPFVTLVSKYCSIVFMYSIIIGFTIKEKN